MRKQLASFLLWYIRFFARLQLYKTKPLIIGIAGSSGKSSLSSLVEIVLEKHFIVNSSKEKNSETGIPLHILGIHMKQFSYLAWFGVLFLAPIKILFYWPKYDVFVAEMGIDSPVEPKNMSYLLKIIRPTIGAVTNVSLEHSVYFEPYVHAATQEEKMQKIYEMTAKEETLLLRSLPKEGVAVINLDDAAVQDVLPKLSATPFTISTKGKADLISRDLTVSLSGFSTTFVYKGETYPLSLKQPLPRHFVYEFLLALGVGISQKVSLKEAIKNIEDNFSLPPGRLQFFQGVKETTLIDSSYNNATLPPILDILDFVSDIAGKRRRVAILGDMRELGDITEKAHQEVAHKILKTIDFAILIGPEMSRFAGPILQKAKFPYVQFATFTQAKEAILNEIKQGDIILVKGSQNTLFLERVVEMLLANKDDVNKLCRRGEFWDKKRSQTP